MPDGSGALHIGYHPLYEPCATIHDVERIGFVAPDLPPHEPGSPGRPSDPVRKADANWTHLAAFAGMIAGRPL
jgi:hypothetical protein